jgi:hypothetical protein
MSNKVNSRACLFGGNVVKNPRPVRNRNRSFSLQQATLLIELFPLTITVNTFMIPKISNFEITKFQNEVQI